MTTLTVDATRETMLTLLSQERHYEFLMLAEPFLRACPDDLHIRLMVVRSYVTLGLFEPAGDTLEEAFARGMTSPELESLRDSIRTLTGDRIDWRSQVDTYRTNLDALRRRGIDTTAIENAWERRQADYALFRDANDVFQIRRSSDRDEACWFPSLRNHPVADENEPLPDSLETPMPQPLIFDGVGLGGLFERVYEKSLNTFLGYSCALYIVEPEAADFAVALHLRDWSGILSDPRVFLFVGPDWQPRIRRFWDEELDTPLPAHALSIGPRTSAVENDRVVRTVESAHAARNDAIRQSLADTEAMYAERTVAYWAKRFTEARRGEGRPLRILAATSTHTTFLQYSMRDAQRAFEAIGCECRVIKEKTNHDIPSPMTYHRAIREFQPDLLFVLDHLRASFGGILPKNLPLLTWDQDQLPHIFTQANVARIAPHDFVAGYCKLRCIELGTNPKQLLYAGVPTCPQQFAGDPLTAREIEKYTCDVSYVSHAAQTPEAFHREERASCNDPTLVRLMDTLFELLPPMLARHYTPHQAVIETVLEDGMRRCGIADLPNDSRARLLSWYLWRLGDRIFRHEALAWIGQWAKDWKRSFRIYGNGWRDHPTLGEFAAGPAVNGRELICIYRVSKINLQLMPSGFIHQRALDGLAAGGFFLTRLTPHDLRGRTLRKLINRVRQLGINSTEALLAGDDEMLARLLHEFYAEHLNHMTSHYPNLHQVLEVKAEVLYPDEVFDNFERIGFDSPDSFAQRANTYLADERLRTDTASSMREKVVEHFSYQAAMRRFLEAMTTYLQEVATRH